MDKLSVISGALFLAADVFAVASLALPEWIVPSGSGQWDHGGSSNFGLIQTCINIYGRPEICFYPEAHPEWLLTFILIVLGCLCVTVTCMLLALSFWEYRVVKYARWIGFTGMILFCVAAVIFPIGFQMEEIGGEAYQLPITFQVGKSYIFFVLALWITVISELFAGKVCLPHF
ncbi:PREDICTED: uncharacterized protein C16orf52 homolog A-like [Priapulus caudatus]|uniref:Uncharacterized protein C16orf52 homolog A-like n=1 Tax=Priapulus caudatus TaxID=37621 RepID=A0ABM1EP27_PRICU|nr:PREDICTED: uncharacterized protein C16orf52 homolog A-like [Priapulus caudatus]